MHAKWFTIRPQAFRSTECRTPAKICTISAPKIDRDVEVTPSTSNPTRYTINPLHLPLKFTPNSFVQSTENSFHTSILAAMRLLSSRISTLTTLLLLSSSAHAIPQCNCANDCVDALHWCGLGVCFSLNLPRPITHTFFLGNSSTLLRSKQCLFPGKSEHLQILDSMRDRLDRYKGSMRYVDEVCLTDGPARWTSAVSNGKSFQFSMSTFATLPYVDI